MKTKFLTVAIVACTFSGMAQKVKSDNAEVRFFSKTPVEDIEAKSLKGVSVIDTVKNELAFVVPNTSFEFANSLMQEHFNEKYMESVKYPKSTFTGVFVEKVDWKKEGEQPANVKGKLTIHGVTLERTIPVVIQIKAGQIKGTSTFMVKTADHKIEIPKLVWEKIAEDIKVSLVAQYK